MAYGAAAGLLFVFLPTVQGMTSMVMAEIPLTMFSFLAVISLARFLDHRRFDRLLLNGLIQPFQQPERVLGFFNVYREGKRVTRKTLTEIADQFQYWLKNRSRKWGAPILDPPDGAGDDVPCARTPLLCASAQPTVLFMFYGWPSGHVWFIRG
jgi:hypothetical protein